MARPLRVQYSGTFVHLIARGNERRRIFQDDHDRLTFLEMLGTAVERFGWILFTYALMPNHFHLFFKLTEETLSQGMHWLNTTYVEYFNHRYDRVGHLYQGRFKSPPVDENAYFLELLRYIALNPVEAGLVERPEDYRWSAHRALIGEVHAPAWLATDDTLIAFAPERTLARGLYRQFVDAGIGVESPIKALVDDPYLGTLDWMRSLRAKIELKPRCDEHPLVQRRVGRPVMVEIVGAVALELGIDEESVRASGGRGRMIAAWLGVNEGLLRNSEIAAGLRVRSSGTVTKLLKTAERELRDNEILQNVIDRCLSTLRRKEDAMKV